MSPSGVATATKVRRGLLGAVVAGELALVVSLHALGWVGTWSSLYWTVCLLAAVIPLVLAAILLFGRGLRFSLRRMLLATACFAVFLFVSASPLIDAYQSRRTSRTLLAAGATLHTVATIDDFYVRLGYDPRPPLPRPVAPRVLPAFLRPLAGDVLAVPTDDEVTEIWVDRDEQIALLCEDPAGLRRLERIGIARGVTAEGMEQLRRSLPDFERVVDVHVSSVPIPAGWLRSLKNVRALHLWGEFGGAGNALSAEHLRDLTALPELKLLMIFRHGITDADAELLEGCRGLEYLILKKTGLTAGGQQPLAEALPDCVVRRD